MSAETVARKDISNEIIPHITNNTYYIEVWDTCVSHIFTKFNRDLNKEILKNLDMGWIRIQFDTEEDMLVWYDINQGKMQFKDLSHGDYYAFDYKPKTD